MKLPEQADEIETITTFKGNKIEIDDRNYYLLSISSITKEPSIASHNDESTEKYSLIDNYSSKGQVLGGSKIQWSRNKNVDSLSTIGISNHFV